MQIASMYQMVMRWLAINTDAAEWQADGEMWCWGCGGFDRLIGWWVSHSGGYAISGDMTGFQSQNVFRSEMEP